MGYIYRFDLFIPEPEPVVANYNINVMFPDDLFQPEVFGDYVVNKYRDFKKKYNILWEKS